MTDKELRRLSRADLLEMLIEQSREVQQLKQQLEETERALHERKIKISSSGSLAEAALKLNNVFEAADAASKQYLENTGVHVYPEVDIERRAKEKAVNYMAEAVRQCKMIEAKTRRICEDMIEKAKTDPAEYERIYGSAAGEKTESRKSEEKRKETGNSGNFRASAGAEARKAKEQILKCFEKYRGYFSRGGSLRDPGRDTVDARDEDIWNIDGADTSRRADRRGGKRVGLRKR